MRPAPLGQRVLLLPLLFGLATLAACHDTTAPGSLAAVADGRVVMAKAGHTLPLLIDQTFVPETERPDYAVMPCGAGTLFPNLFRAEGVLTPQMGRTKSVLINVACSLGPDSIRIAGVGRHAGVTGDTLYAVWSGFITNLQGGTGTLTLHMAMVRGTGRFQHLVGDVEATGEIDLATRAGWYRGTGTLRDRPPLAGAGPQLLPETITAGEYHSCGLSASGAAYCWGRNGYGQLGDGTTTSRNTPTPVAGGLTFTNISAARGNLESGHTCGVTSSGAAYCWGSNSKGQLGDGTKTSHLTPTPVTGGLSFAQISAGDRHTCGVTTSGAAYCWGWNFEGQLGNGEGPIAADRPNPTAVLGGITFKQISAGQVHTCGVTPAGVAFCWGLASYGKLGAWETDVTQVTPYPVAGGLLFKEISAAMYHTCGLTTSGVANCWGRNDYGQLGDGTQSGPYDSWNTEPRAVAGGLVFARISAGGYHSCGVTVSGTAYCWGENLFGQLGIGTAGGNALTPRVVQEELRFTQISAGGGQTCAVAISGVAYCWGVNYDGQLGDNTNGSRLSPAVAAKLTLTFDRLSAGGYHTCSLTAAGAAYCWGADYSGQLGDGTTAVSRFSPTAVVGGIVFYRISSGYDHTCGLTVNGVAYCWGDNSSGQLGNGTTASASVPTPVSGGLVFARIGAGVEHTCGIANTGAAYCWGGNGSGQLADGTTTPHLTPNAVTGGNLFAELAVGSYHACALTNAGQAYCWGSDGVIEYRFPNVVSGGLVFTQLSAGSRFTCGLSGGAAHCWGSNTDGQLGDGTTLNHPFPAPVSGGLSFTQLTTGESHTCALTASGSTYCWGWNYYGQLGDGSSSPQSTPVAVAGGFTFSRISAGLHHSCGVSAGTDYCWGRGDNGQTGGGTRLIPTIVTAVSFKP
jgi:alpha-tubulin suppressor-like RCC1 family protein